jgi:hypothetical protein
LPANPWGVTTVAIFVDVDHDPLTGYREGTGADYIYAFSVMP